MTKKTKKIFVLLSLVLVSALLLTAFQWPDSVPKNYTETVKTGGKLEAKYLKNGKSDVSYFESDALMSFKKFEIYYPSDIADRTKPLPVVIFVNGTGTGGSKYPALQQHMASWGFITVATEEEHAWNGFSAEMSVRLLERLNKDSSEFGGKENVFYGKIDLKRVGITGHSQGGFGVVNAMTDQRHKDNYKAAVILSSNAQPNGDLLWDADATKIKAPTLIIGSTGTLDAALAPIDSLKTLYKQIPESTPKMLARRNDADHGEMLYFADGYVTAWFLWHLQGNKTAAKAFSGNSPEIMQNSLYQNRRTNIK